MKKVLYNIDDKFKELKAESLYLYGILAAYKGSISRKYIKDLTGFNDDQVDEYLKELNEAGYIKDYPDYKLADIDKLEGEKINISYGAIRLFLTLSQKEESPIDYYYIKTYMLLLYYCSQNKGTDKRKLNSDLIDPELGINKDPFCIQLKNLEEASIIKFKNGSQNTITLMI